MLKFYKCEGCKNLVELLHDGGGIPECCGKAMRELIPNTEDASNEKHIPFVRTVDGRISAAVGSVEHPMEAKHYIEWILFDNGEKRTRVSLKPGQKPEACIGPVQNCVVYAYCNIHGLWKSNFS